MNAGSILERLGLDSPGQQAPESSPLHFVDGSRYRIEIPTVEGPQALRAVLDEASGLSVPVHRVSQGSGATLVSDAELAELAELQDSHGVDVLLFVGPRAGWDIGAQAASSAGQLMYGSLRGADQLHHGVDDVGRVAEAGIRGVLVADLGLLSVLGRMKGAGFLPGDFQLKSSVFLPAANPATARLLEELGATSLNVPVDLPIADLAGIRAAVSIPLDVYVECPDDFGGVVRYYDIPEMVRTLSPVYLKFAVKNAPGLYPSGVHLDAVATATARARVHRAARGIELLHRHPCPASAVSTADED